MQMDGQGINYHRPERIWKQEDLNVPVKNSVQESTWAERQILHSTQAGVEKSLMALRLCALPHCQRQIISHVGDHG